jgi:hypothetical protein
MRVGAVRRGSRGRGRRLESQSAKYYEVKDCTEPMLCCYDLHFLFLLLYIDTLNPELERNIRTPVLGVYTVMKMMRWLIGQRSLTVQVTRIDVETPLEMLVTCKRLSTHYAHALKKKNKNYGLTSSRFRVD